MRRLLLSLLRSSILAVLLLSRGVTPAFGAEEFQSDRCLRFFTESLRKLDHPPGMPVKFRPAFGSMPEIEKIEVHHLKGMLGEYGNRVDLALYAKARSILLLADGSESRSLDRLGPMLAREFPEKAVISADVDVMENQLVRNWGRVKINHLNQFPVKDNSFDRIVLRKGMCQCHSAICCAGFDPHSAQAKHFFREVIRVLDKSDPGSFAVLHGMYNVGGNDVRVWSAMLEDLSRFYPIEYRIILDQGFFHSILIRPKAIH